MSNYITNNILIETYIDQKLIGYLIRKCSNLSHEDVVLRTCEVLKYLYFGKYGLGPIPFNQDLDDIWHLLILQTKQYREITEKMPHKRFINHSSTEYDLPKPLDDVQRRQELNRQISYLVSYIKNFGPISESAIQFYPVGFALFKRSGEDIIKVNEYLVSLSEKFKPR
jgi:hypothetical protein